jgi:hypothetical protein
MFRPSSGRLRTADPLQPVITVVGTQTGHGREELPCGIATGTNRGKAAPMVLVRLLQ